MQYANFFKLIDDSGSLVVISLTAYFSMGKIKYFRLIKTI